MGRPTTKGGSRPRRPGFSRELPCADLLLPIWDDLASLAESEERELEVIPWNKGAYLFIGETTNGLEVIRVHGHGEEPEPIPLSIQQRASLFGAHRRSSSHVRYVILVADRPVVLTPSPRLARAVHRACAAGEEHAAARGGEPVPCAEAPQTP